MQFAEPGENRSTIEEHVSNCTLAGIRAVGVRSVGEAVESKLILAEVVGEANTNSSFEVANQVLESLPVSHPWIGHVLAELVHSVGDIGASPARNEICKSDQAAVQGAVFGSLGRFRASHNARLRWRGDGIAVFHSSTFQQRVDRVALSNFHCASQWVILDVHAEEGI